MQVTATESLSKDELIDVLAKFNLILIAVVNRLSICQIGNSQRRSSHCRGINHPPVHRVSFTNQFFDIFFTDR